MRSDNILALNVPSGLLQVTLACQGIPINSVLACLQASKRRHGRRGGVEVPLVGSGLPWVIVLPCCLLDNACIILQKTNGRPVIPE